jgi:hypothetical protein
MYILSPVRDSQCLTDETNHNRASTYAYLHLKRLPIELPSCPPYLFINVNITRGVQ